MRTLAVLAWLVASPLAAQTCPSPAGWLKPTRHLAARAPDMKFALATGTSNEIGLLPAKAVKLAVKGDRPPKPGSTAGLAALDVAKAGKLDIILSNATYVDLVRDGKTVKSIGHTDLKTCPGLRKSVTFGVVPGRYLVQLTGAPEKSVKMATVLR
jgi:hypothetical protein